MEISYHNVQTDWNLEFLDKKSNGIKSGDGAVLCPMEYGTQHYIQETFINDFNPKWSSFKWKLGWVILGKLYSH